MLKLQDVTEWFDIAIAQVTSRVEHMDKERTDFRDDLSYLKAQSMRNNLIFTGVPAKQCDRKRNTGSNGEKATRISPHSIKNPKGSC
ncbi:hypothetical protein DPMN_046079 [Dreissena polymorpha]|uniref:Uncharacterized protein n=1 Tax=Dreissena polymorpha TaxID=45954 RepID=A0A9D4D639_DREPO|nr:hypothetical protein DPMN_046079 [Dreissena polymorpha]